MSETVVVAYDQCLDLQAVAQYLSHEIVGREACHLGVEVEQHTLVYLCVGQMIELGG